MALSKKKRTAIIIVSVILGLLVIGAIVFGILRKPIIQPDQASQDRITRIEEVLVSHFGRSWYVTLIGLGIVLVIFMLLLFLLSLKNIQIGDKGEDAIVKGMIALTVVISIGIIFGGIVALVSYIQNRKQETEEQGDFATRSKARGIMEIFAMGIGLLFLIGIGLGVVFYIKALKKKREKSI